MKGTALVYSAHAPCHYIHENRIVQRALEGKYNKRILFLPMSETPHPNGDEFPSQRFGYHKFKWFFDRYTKYGLEVVPFYYASSLAAHDVEKLMNNIRSSEVVFFGGGNPWTGMRRFLHLGQKFYNDSHYMHKLLWERQRKGLLTVGFSAGAEQLCDSCFGLIKGVEVSLHHEYGRSSVVRDLARKHPRSLAFGLPNDSGIEANQGPLGNGALYQIIDFIIDRSWDRPEDQWHIKTRAGTKIDHFYPDGGHWAFNAGDKLVRILYPNGFYKAWTICGGKIMYYRSTNRAPYSSIQQILEANA